MIRLLRAYVYGVRLVVIVAVAVVLLALVGIPEAILRRRGN